MSVGERLTVYSYSLTRLKAIGVEVAGVGWFGAAKNDGLKVKSAEAWRD